MSSSSADQSFEVRLSKAGRATGVDRALLLALAAWSDRWPSHNQGPAHNPALAFLTTAHPRLPPPQLELLRDAIDGDALAGARIDPSRAMDELRKLHTAMARVDLARVHVSWWIRALREESPAVQRLVAASLPQSFRFRLQAGLLLDSQDLASERPAAAEVARWVMALWSERLVGGEAERADDPAAIVLLSRLSPRSGYRLCRLAGLSKLILAGGNQEQPGKNRTRAGHAWLESRLADVDPGVRTLAKADAESSQFSRLPPRHRMARIGLTTVARLLSTAEPFRLRWALQHWPYPIAKLIRTLIPSATNSTSDVLLSEALILKTAWDRLDLEGKLLLPWPQPPDESPRSSPS
jgi:hypothetical protein